MTMTTTQPFVPTYFVEKNQTEVASAGTPNKTPSTMPFSPPITPTNPAKNSRTNGSATYHFVTTDPFPVSMTVQEPNDG